MADRPAVRGLSGHRARLAAAAFALLAPSGAWAQDSVTSYVREASFADVVADLSDAIVNRGLVVDHHGLIGDMLKRTGAALGLAGSPYRAAEFFQFCSASLSRAAMEQDPGNIAYCPYSVFVYETEGRPGQIVIGFRRLPPGDGRDPINSLLDSIAVEAAGN